MARFQVGDRLPEHHHRPDEVQLFLYNAAIGNPHRIHYDQPYTTATEGHPGLLIDGPLQGDYLTQLVLEWMGAHGRLTAFQYSNRQAAYLGETLTVRGEVAGIRKTDGEVTLSLAVLNESGEVITPGSATVRFPA